MWCPEYVEPFVTLLPETMRRGFSVDVAACREADSCLMISLYRNTSSTEEIPPGVPIAHVHFVQRVAPDLEIQRLSRPLPPLEGVGPRSSDEHPAVRTTAPPPNR
jgi:hypothetical protein